MENRQKSQNLAASQVEFIFLVHSLFCNQIWKCWFKSSILYSEFANS